MTRWQEHKTAALITQEVSTPQAHLTPSPNAGTVRKKVTFSRTQILMVPRGTWVTRVSIPRRSHNFLERRFLKRRIRGSDLGVNYCKWVRPDTWYLYGFYVPTCHDAHEGKGCVSKKEPEQ